MNEMVEKDNTAMSTLEADLAARAQLMKTNIIIASNNIQVQKTGTFKMPGGEEREELEAVILDYRYRNQFFPKVYRKGEFTPADCFSIGSSPSSMEPSIEAPKPPAEKCMGCAMNEFGSALNGGRGKACQNQFLLAIMLPDLGESEEIFVIKASPTTVKALAGYVSKMVDQFGHPIKIITKFTVDTTGDWAKLKATYAGPNGAYNEHAEYLTMAASLLESVPKKETVTTPVDTLDTAAARGSKKRER